MIWVGLGPEGRVEPPEWLEIVKTPPSRINFVVGVGRCILKEGTKKT